MKRHIGVKLVDAREMTRGRYNDYRGWDIPEGENSDDTGFLVEYLDGGEPNHSQHKGYISWSPTTVFINSYRPTDGLNFGLAIEAMKLGKKVAREGWNGKDMFIYMDPGSEVPAAKLKSFVLRHLNPDSPSSAITILPHIDMWTTNAHGRRGICVGWLASQTDMLSDDWFIVE